MTTVRAKLYRWFLLIQEPRIVRIAMFAIYVYFIVAGVQAFTSTPDHFYQVTGPRIVFSIGVFFIVGGVVGLVAVLPGHWYIERVGLVALALGCLARGVLVSALGVSDVGASILNILILFLFVRFLTIRRADYAPIAPPVTG
jgi:hypothetical protein